MAFTTATDLQTLKSRSFLTDYMKNRTKFIEVGKIVYQALLNHGGTVPAEADMERPLAVALQSTTLFNTLCAAKPHANPVFYPTFAYALARYILDDSWNEISTP